MAKILIIEDDPGISKVISSRLSREEYTVLLAADGEEGLRKAQEENPDLIILDLMLPKLDGFEVLKSIKDDDKTKGVPVIILSNLGQTKDIDRGMKLGASDYLIKTDFSISEIIDKVRTNILKGKKED